MEQGQTAVKREHSNLSERLLNEASRARGAKLTWAVASSNRMLDAQIREGVPSNLFQGISKNLLELLEKVESIPGEGAPSVEQLLETRNLLVKAAHSLAVESEKLSELRLLALTDDLTGFYNRRGFLILAMQQLKVSRRNSQPTLLFFVDVDGLKSTNDLYGHDEGDALLLRCAAALNNTFRDSDIIARLGGDEFAVLAPECADRTSQAIIQRLGSAVDRVNGQGMTSLSLSVGTARFNPQAPITLAELLTVADCDMYQNKRNRMGAATEASVIGD